MAFWKQSDDPWDRKPDKRPPQPREPKEPKENPVDTLKAWNEQRKAAAKEKEEARRLPPEKCPWCGKDMEQGFLYTGRDPIQWYPGIYKTAWFKRDRTGSFRVDTYEDDSAWATYKTSWLCRDCKKIVFNVPDPEEYTPRVISPASNQSNEAKEEDGSED